MRRKHYYAIQAVMIGFALSASALVVAQINGPKQSGKDQIQITKANEPSLPATLEWIKEKLINLKFEYIETMTSPHSDMTSENRRHYENVDSKDCTLQWTSVSSSVPTKYVPHHADHKIFMDWEGHTTFVYADGRKKTEKGEKPKETRHSFTVHLKDIDPLRIKAEKFSYPSDLGKYQFDPEKWHVLLSTTGNTKTVRFAMDGLDDGKESLSTGAYFEINDFDLANRFVSALSHAVKLCGGKAGAPDASVPKELF